MRFHEGIYGTGGSPGVCLWDWWPNFAEKKSHFDRSKVREKSGQKARRRVGVGAGSGDGERSRIKLRVQREGVTQTVFIE